MALSCATLISLFTGILFDLACGPYSGKQTGETALMRKLLDVLRPGDTLIADSYHCTFWLIVACQMRGVNIVMKNHDKRDDPPTHARRLRKGERLVNWELPPRPAWITKVEYAQMPQSVEIRLVVSAGVQSDATEDASEWCGRRS